MNKKFTTLLIACFTLLSTANAQQYNLFNPADVDADGWLWFDTQEKIDKYIGQANNEDGMYDPNGKLIQLVAADYGDNEDSLADPSFVGAGTDGVQDGVNAKTGSIKLAISKSDNGGGIIIRLPSCTSFNINLSCSKKFYLAFKGSTTNQNINSYTGLRTYSIMPLPGGPGQKTWNEMETLETTSGFKLAQSSEVYTFIQNWGSVPLYIHGIKALTSTQGASIGGESMNSSLSFDGKTVSINEPATINVYNVAGTLVASEYTNSMNLSNLAKGIYIVKANQETAKIAIR